MNIILLSGGSGQRLWPMSNDVRSKQFIKIFQRQDNAYESMVQRMYRRIRAIEPDSMIVIAAPKAQISALRNQLGNDIDVSVEPCRRDTFPAIALAAAYIHDVRGVPEGEPIVICPVDPYVDDDYFVSLKRLEKQVEKNEANLVLMGIEPTYPSEKYGYIIPDGRDEVSGVSFFKEKPEAEIAKQYIEQGGLWNSGVFACSLGYILNRAHELIDFIDYPDLFSKYETLNKISFDYAVAERESSIQVLRFSGQWKDLGTWNTFTEAMGSSSVGNVIMDSKSTNTHVLNELSIPILAMGLHDVVISAGPQGILVSDKEQSSYIKPFVDKLDQQIRFAEKSWGSYQVLNIEQESLTILVSLRSSHRMNYHSHRNRDEIWAVISGTGYTIVDGMEQKIQPGDVITMQAGCRHTVIAETELKLIEVQLGKEISVHDKQKYPFEP